MIWIGTSGWQYSSWRERFSPPDVPQTRWLEFSVQHFDTQELNNSFYRLPTADACDRLGLPRTRVPELKSVRVG